MDSTPSLRLQWCGQKAAVPSAVSQYAHKKTGKFKPTQKTKKKSQSPYANTALNPVPKKDSSLDKKLFLLILVDKVVHDIRPEYVTI